MPFCNIALKFVLFKFLWFYESLLLQQIKAHNFQKSLGK